MRLVSMLAPPRCAICAAACGSADTVCARCARELSATRPGSAALRDQTPLVWATTYEGTPRALVSALKFGGRLALADLAAETIVAAVGARATAPAPTGAVVPVPPGTLRRRWRGFDPAELIATRVGAQLGLPLSRCLRRLDHRRQVGKSRVRRLAEAPRIRARGPLPDRALLIDDVMTTGATLSACAAALRDGGCRLNEAAVYARSTRVSGR